MTLRTAALVLVVVLALPALPALLRMARTAPDEGGGARRRGLEALWVATPVVLLAGLIVLSATA